MNKFLLVTIISLLPLIYGNAQITIGSDKKPASGAILDLKQEEKTGGLTNSEKGLGLPRVGLLYLSIPNGKTSLATTIDQASGNWDADDHIGLVVYNVNEEFRGSSEVCPVDIFYPIDGMKKGPHVWDGKEWKYLGLTSNNTIEESDNVAFVIDDRDQEKYPYRAFGDPNDPENFAGYWTLENARYIDDNMIYGQSNDKLKRTYMYPNGDNQSETPPATWRPNQGLLYNYSAATLGGQDEYWNDNNENYPEQGQESGSVENTPIMQGVCPKGWHVPTDREWNKLARVIYNNPTEYSKYTSSFSTPWDENTEIENTAVQGVDNDEGLGIAMLSACSPLFINDDGKIDRNVSVGKSKSSVAGGFNALLVNGDINDYGTFAGFWTSSIVGGDAGDVAWGRAITADSPEGVLRYQADVHKLMSVRCKKD